MKDWLIIDDRFVDKYISIYLSSADSVLKRITLFTEKTRPVIEKYKKIVKQVIKQRRDYFEIQFPRFE